MTKNDLAIRFLLPTLSIQWDQTGGLALKEILNGEELYLNDQEVEALRQELTR